MKIEHVFIIVIVVLIGLANNENFLRWVLQP